MNANRQRTGQECCHRIFSGIRYANGTKGQGMWKRNYNQLSTNDTKLYSVRETGGREFDMQNDLNRSCRILQHGVSYLVWGLRKTMVKVRGTTTGVQRVTSDHRTTSSWNETRHTFGYCSVWGRYYGCTTEWCEGALYSTLLIPCLPSRMINCAGLADASLL